MDYNKNNDIHQSHHEWLNTNIVKLIPLIESAEEWLAIYKDMKKRLIWAIFYLALTMMVSLMGLGIMKWAEGVGIL